MNVYKRDGKLRDLLNLGLTNTFDVLYRSVQPAMKLKNQWGREQYPAPINLPKISASIINL